jgi:hypothetical protein
MMAVLICPECGADNLLDAEQCQLCGASLEGVIPADPPQDDALPLPQADEDLTDLLSSLRQDEVLGEISAEHQEGSPPASEAEMAEENPDGADDETEVPEWLNRIRQRAQTEPDSVGEITQKISAARESLEAEKNKVQQSQFEDLLQKIHGEDEALPSSEIPDVEDNAEISIPPGTARADWLKRIRKKHRPAEAERPEEILSEREGDSLLQWLVALENGDDTAEDLSADVPAGTADDAEATRELTHLSAAEEHTREIALGALKRLPRREMELNINREEQARADQLTATISDEKAVRPERTPERLFFPRGLRLALGALLIIILSYALFNGIPGDLPTSTPRPQSQAVVDWAQGLPAGSSVLLVLDYPAAFSAEMTLIASPILREIYAAGAEVSILSSAPAGSLLFDRLLADADLPDSPVIQDLGFYPVGSFGAYGLAYQESPTQGQSELLMGTPAESLDGILILGDDYEGTMAWVEQLSSLMPATPVLLLVSAQAEPLLLPYWESGQVVGMVSGILDAVDLAGQPAEIVARWRAYQVGTVLMILMLLIGMSFPAPQRQHPEGQDG